MPRVIAGVAGGIPLKAPPGDGTRPTTDRTKESVFNMIQADIPEAQVLDLFAGSGGLGIEALSRGAAFAVFVEADRTVCDLILQNLKKTRLSDQAEVMCRDVGLAIRQLALEGRKFHLVFADAPYRRDFVLKTLLLLDENDIMMHDGMAVVEHHREESPPQSVARWLLERRREYGETVFSFYLHQSTTGTERTMHGHIRLPGQL